MKASKFFVVSVITLLALTLSATVLVQADDSTVTEEEVILDLPEVPELPEALNLEEATVLERIPGTVEGTGTYFEVTDSEYFNVTLVSSEPVQLTLESMPEMVTMHIEAADGATSTHITLGGLESTTTYYKYTDNYRNLEELRTDDSGTCVYTQDLSEPHLVFIQPTASTIFLTRHGWSTPGIGTWDESTLTATLITDVSETIQIEGNDITLDGNGHRVMGSGTGIGIYVFMGRRIAVRKVDVEGFQNGIMLSHSLGYTS